MKKQRMYIPVIKDFLDPSKEDYTTKSITLLNANKIEGLEKYLPETEALEVHMKIQRIKLQRDENYKPQPLYIPIERDIFNSLIEKIQAKNNQALKDCIPLVLQSQAIPICILVKKSE